MTQMFQNHKRERCHVFAKNIKVLVV